MNIGLVLSGGMAKGAYELGALKAVSERFRPEEINYISAASVGALAAFSFASGSLDNAFCIWREISASYGKVFVKRAIESREFIEWTVRSASEKLLCKRLYVPLFNLRTMNNYYVDLVSQKEDTEKYLQASVAVFPICNPVNIQDKLYYDGAVIDNIPVYPLLKYPLDYLICIYFDEYNYLFESKYFDNKMIKISFLDSQDVLSRTLFLTKESTEEMLEIGYRKTRAILDYVFSGGSEDTDRIYSRIEEMNMMNQNVRHRLTGDVVINNLNKITRHISKRKITDKRW